MKTRCNAQARPPSLHCVRRACAILTNSRLLLLGTALLLTSELAGAETRLPLVEEVEWAPFREQCRALLRKMDEDKSPLPAESTRSVRALLDGKPDDPREAVQAAQKLLDPHCLLGVSINPESRVKAQRGPAAARLRQDREILVLIKVHNDGGVTHDLRVRGPEIVRAGQRDDERWLRAVLVTEPPFGPKLSGRRLEYRLLRLLSHQSGKREATFQFDVGQGTQDLGFRAEVPILFSIARPD